MDCYGKYYYLDGLICPSGVEDETPSGETSFYEVIRTMGGVPLFFDDHIKRLLDGITTRYNVPVKMAENISSGIAALVESEPVPEINVRVTVTFTGQEHSIHICYLISQYPTERMYDEGVDVILHHAERFDPGVKLLNMRLRLSINEELNKRGAYEALLVNKDGYITEGSRSNVFFVTKDNKVCTAPDSMVLSGITRKYVLEICKKEGIEICFEPVKANLISSFPTAFITGTSPMVLPAGRIENVTFITNNPLVRRLYKLYAGMAKESIRNYLIKKQAD